MQILIICPIQDEYDATKKLLTSIRIKIGKVTKRSYLCGSYGRSRIFLLQSDRGIDAVSNAVHAAMRDFGFTHIFLVGTAGGLNDKVKIGDLVIATVAHDYESGRVVNDGFYNFPKTLTTKPAILDLAKSKKDYIYHSIPTFVEEKVKIHFKPIASGSKVIESTDSQSYQILRERFNDAVALEMEAYAFQSALNQYPKVQGLNIRSIADMLSDKQHANAQGSKALASHHAALFALGLIEQIKQPKAMWQNLSVGAALSAVLLVALVAWTNFNVKNTETEIYDLPNVQDTTFIELEKVTPSLSTEVSPEQTNPGIAKNSEATPNPSVQKEIELTKESPSDTIAIVTLDTLMNQFNSPTTLPEEEDVDKGTKVTYTEKIHYVERCYIGVVDGDEEISNVSIYVNGKREQIANNYLKLPVGKVWIRLEKEGRYYEKSVNIKKEHHPKPVYMIEWKDFTPKRSFNVKNSKGN